MKEIVKHIDGGRLLLEADRRIYDVKAILNAAYKFTARCQEFRNNYPASHNYPSEDVILKESIF